MRLFVAIDVSKEVRDYLLKIQSKLDQDLRFVNAFHLTLKYLGEVSEDLIPKITAKLEEIKFNPFDLELNEIGSFPNKKFIKVIWIGVKDQSKLMKLQKEVENNLKEFNFKKQFNFHPHITLARVNKKIDFPNIKIKNLKFPVSKFFLYQSTLTPNGPTYTKLKDF